MLLDVGLVFEAVVLGAVRKERGFPSDIQGEGRKVNGPCGILPLTDVLPPIYALVMCLYKSNSSPQDTV